MKKLLLIALAFAGLNAMAGTISIKPVMKTPTCNGGTDGKISFVIEGGTSPYYYVWSNDTTAHFGASQSNLSAGTYTVTVYDAAGDTGTYSVVLGQPTPIQVYPSAQQADSGQSNGAISVLVQGGMPGYTYHWNNNAATQDIYDLQPGTYTVTVTDELGCTSSKSQYVGELMPVHLMHNPDAPFHAHLSNAPSPKGNGNSNTEKDGTAGVENDGNNQNDVLVYPNPASSYVNLNLNSATASEITLYNSAGQVVMNKIAEGNQERLDISSLAKGNYIMAISNENGTSTKTIAVVK